MSSEESQERKLFKRLENLCSRDGFIHAFSYLCRRDASFTYTGAMSGQDLSRFYNPKRLIRSELSAIHGLILKSNTSLEQISQDEIAKWSQEADDLLEQLHECLINSGYERFNRKSMKLSMSEFFSHKDIIREYVFYSAEQAFCFQFASLSVERYHKDREWLTTNFGFDMKDALAIFKAISNQLNNNLDSASKNNSNSQDFRSYLKDIELDLGQITRQSKLDFGKIEAFLSAFSTNYKCGNNDYNSIDDINIANFKPILEIEGKYYLFQLTSLAQSMYESPIFWIRSDKNYLNEAVKNRGDFTESFAFKKLEKVFGKENIYRNLDIYKSASEKVGEIDILAKFGTKFLIVQAKSKGMTALARQGKVNLVKEDFGKAVQNAYDQSVECSEALLSGGMIIKDSSGNVLDLGSQPTACYPVCLTSESYPGLLIQCRKYLDFRVNEFIKPPFIMDIFFLDILTEFLSQPIFLLSYVDRRSSYFDEVIANTEIVLLGFHLKRNLWLEEKFTLMSLEDDLAADIDAAFMVRRMGLKGIRTPEGLLKRYTESFLNKILFKLQRVERDELTDFAFTLMKANGTFLDTLDSAVARVCFDSIQDGSAHNFTILFGGNSGGMTLSTSTKNQEENEKALLSYMNARKYKEKQDKWFGVIIDPHSQMVREIIFVNESWSYDSAMEDWLKTLNLKSEGTPCLQTLKRTLKFKVGRNDKCTCGSGKKFKHCCGR